MAITVSEPPSGSPTEIVESVLLASSASVSLAGAASVGASGTGVIATVTVAVSVAPPDMTVYANESVPLAFAVGV